MSVEELDRFLAETDDEKESKQLIFLKRVYKGASLADAADDIGKSGSTGSRWAERWNEGGLGLLTPNFGDGRPPKLDEAERQQFIERLREGEPWKKQKIQYTLIDEFDVEYHPNYLPELLSDLDLSYTIPRTERPSWSENAEGIFDEEAYDAPHNNSEDDEDDDENEDEWDCDEDIRTDGGAVIGLFDVSHPQPSDNSQRMYTVDDQTITRPLLKIDTPAAGFYALTGESVPSFPPNQKKKQICDCFEKIREQNPFTGILLVLDNFSSHVCKYTRKRAHHLGIYLVFLPVGSPHLNPIEPVWKSVKFESSPFIVENGDEYCSRISQLFNKLTEKLSFAATWIDNHLKGFLHKLS